MSSSGRTPSLLHSCAGLRIWMVLAAMTTLLCPVVRTAAAQEDRQAKLDFFESKIRPVLVKHCYSCHSREAETVQGNLYLDSRPGWEQGGDSGPAITPGAPDESLLLEALRYDGFEMPPKGKLDDQVLDDFARWIRDGAHDPRSDNTVAPASEIDYAEAADFWAFQPPRLPELPPTSTSPEAKSPALPSQPIDRLIDARLAEAGLTPNPSATPEVLLRRASYNLLGLPPTPAEIDRFVEDWRRDPNSAWESLVDRLLASDHYGERWGRHWLDVARYGEDQAHTFKARKYPRGYLYRDWVVDALNQDMPYDEFLLHQIAGDLLPDDTKRHERLAALGLFALGPVYYAENVEQAKAHADEWDDRVDTLMRGVLGLTVSCARCHDHKYDPISMKDYYGLAGIFASSQYEEQAVVPREVIQQRRAADERAQQEQLAVDRFLTDISRTIRPGLLDTLPELLAAALEFDDQQRVKPAPNDKERQKQLAKFAAERKLSPTLLERWLAVPKESKSWSSEEQALVSEWVSELTPGSNRPKDAEDEGDARQGRVRNIARQIQTQLEPLLSERERLREQFGANIAFVKSEDRAAVPPGVIPLGNLFDDAATTPLDAALASDKFKATASEKNLGVVRVANGWGARTHIAPEVRFDFRRLGSDDRAFGAISNDAWNTQGGIRTAGSRADTNLKRDEQGIGMHANALITFDLQAIRRAGLLPDSQRFRFLVDRAGLNDDVFGTDNSSAHLAVILSRPHRDKAVTDAILAGYVNGQKMDVATDDFTYYFAGELPEPLKADGKFISIDLAIPLEARYLTLVATGAASPDDNSISSDHTVFSGARLQLDPLPPAPVVANESSDTSDQPDEAARNNALLLSRVFDDEGLLGVPATEVEPLLDASSQASLASLREKAEEAKQAAEKIEVLKAHSLTDGKPRDLPIYLQGDPARHGDVAPRSFPAIFNSGERMPFETEGSGRLELARAITSKDNPLTARVIVNRVWAGHFGQGLVTTRSNFGALGERPSHPELLDYLAVQFMQHGWSLKWLHREIMMSAAFCRSSEHQDAARSVDPENRLLWRMNRRRLEIEPWRDTLLAVTGELDRTLGGPSKQLTDPNHQRRTLYSFISRHRLDEQLRLFDFPDPNITAARRTQTTVPLQQLFILNSDFMMQRARALAERVRDEIPEDESQRIRFLYRLLYGRWPSADEIALGTTFLAQGEIPSSSSNSTETASPEGSPTDDNLDRWQQYVLALLSANELMYID